MGELVKYAFTYLSASGRRGLTHRIISIFNKRKRKKTRPLIVLTNYPITMFPRRLEPFLEQLLELPKRRRLDFPQYFNILQREFERGSFESDISRRVGKHETKIDVDEVSVAVEEDVAVVSVFDLEEVGDEGVACERFGKVALGPGEFG